MYYRFRNILTPRQQVLKRTFLAEILLQLAKENYGLSNLEQMLTEPVSIGEEDVSDFDDAEQASAANKAAGSGQKALHSSNSMPKIFRTFKTDNPRCKHTLLPYGSRTPIEDDPTE